MTDTHKLVERVRELTEQTDGSEPELRRRDRPPRSQAQRRRVEGAETLPAIAAQEAADPAGSDDRG